MNKKLLWMVAALMLGSPVLHSETEQEIGGAPAAREIVHKAHELKPAHVDTASINIGSFKRYRLHVADTSQTYIVVRSGPSLRNDISTINRFLDAFIPCKFQKVKPGNRFSAGQNDIVARAANIPIKTIDEMMAEAHLTETQSRKDEAYWKAAFNDGSLALIASEDKPQSEAGAIYIEELRSGVPGTMNQTLVVVASEAKKAEFRRLFHGIIPFELLESKPNEDSIAQQNFPFPQYPYRFPQVLIMTLDEMQRAMTGEERLHELQTLLETHLAVIDRIISTTNNITPED